VATESEAPVTFTALASGWGVQPAMLVWLRHTATANVQTPWHWPSASHAGSPSVQLSLLAPVAPRTSNAP
jgi:hypothetical protein